MRLLPPLLRDPALHELVVVVDGSDDGSYELLRNLARGEPRIIPLFIPNQGEAAARTHGVRQATGEVVVILDDDVEAAPGLVTAHAEGHVTEPDLVLVGYMPVVDPEPLGARLYADRYEAHCRRWLDDPGSVLRTLWAGNMSLRRDAYLEVVAQDPPRHRYDFHADRVFGLRCEAAGLRGVFDLGCRAVHHYSRSLDGLSTDARNQGLALVRLHDEFPSQSPPLTPVQFTWYLPSYQRPLVNLCRRPTAAALVSAALRETVRLIDSLGAPKAAELATLMMTIERQTGAILATQQIRSSPADPGADRMIRRPALRLPLGAQRGSA